MHRLLFLIALLSLAGNGRADTSFLHKVAVLRFGQEAIVSFDQGTLDLKKIPVDGYLHAQGEIYFVPGEFLDPVYLDAESFQNLLRDKAAIKAPLRLKTFPSPLPGTDSSFGTFVMRFHNAQPQRLAFGIPRQFHPLQLFFVDQTHSARLLVHGVLNKDPEQNRNFSEAATPTPVIETGGDFYLYAQVSAPLVNGRNTLNFSTFYIGKESYLNRMIYQSRFYASVFAGSFLIIVIFYFFIYIFRRQDRSSLYLCLYAASCFVLSLLYTLTFPLTNQEVLDVFTVVNVLGVACLQSYLLDKIAFLWTRRTYRLLIMSAFFVAIGLTFSLVLQVSPLVALFLMFSFVSSIGLILVTLYFGIRHRLNGISFFLCGTVLNLGFQYPIMMTYIQNLNAENGYNILMANFCMALALALVNAKEFAVTYQEISYFNKNLEKLVDNKTKEVRALLDYIPQGVLSLDGEGRVNKDFSAHLQRILGHGEIAQQSFKSLILDRCDLSSDARDQAWQSIRASVGESVLNFETNADKLPGEFLFRSPVGEKFLKATWNVEVEDDIVLRLLVTLLDCTAERAALRDAESQRKELVLIQELLNVSASKMAQFFSTSLPLLKENERIIHQEKTLSSSSIRMLFVNVHTVKGAARTLQLRDLARQLHDMEEYYAHVLKDNQPQHRDRMKEDIAASFQVLERYMDINRNKLNRVDSFSKVIIEREFIEKHYFFIKDMVDTPPDVSNIIDWLREQNELLTRLIFDQLPASFDGYKDRATRIARDLGRADPLFDFSIDDVSIPPDQKTALDNCMVHLLRNALDHGIESPAERRRRGKPEQGCIRAHTSLDNRNLIILISDDGRGLAIHKLRKKGETLGLLNAHSSLADVAHVIFAPGVSTAHEISEISGRGVGMNAVQMFMESVGGTIAVKLGAPKDDAQEYYDFAFEIRFQLGQTTLAKAS